MRIIKFFITSFLFVGIVAVVVALIARESVLWIAASRVSASIDDLRAQASSPRSFLNACIAKGSLDNSSIIDHLQLRFTSPTEYRIEAICSSFPQDPIVVSKSELPMPVHKVAGSGGILWGDERSGVELELFGRHRTVVLEQKIASIVNGKVDLGTVTPQTTCEGFGYQCCQPESAIGKGTGYTQVTDCPKSCYAACLPRPIVLSFTSDPFPDTATRIVHATVGTTVIFSYVIESDVKGKTAITIEYGDGKSEPQTALSGQATHVYSCPTAQCKYTASISAVDHNGTLSAVTPISSLSLSVKR